MYMYYFCLSCRNSCNDGSEFKATSHVAIKKISVKSAILPTRHMIISELAVWSGSRVAVLLPVPYGSSSSCARMG